MFVVHAGGGDTAAKIRGLCFYLWTLALSVPLFVVMLVMAPFVMLRDRVRWAVQPSGRALVPKQNCYQESPLAYPLFVVILIRAASAMLCVVQEARTPHRPVSLHLGYCCCQSRIISWRPLQHCTRQRPTKAHHAVVFSIFLLN